MTWKGIYLIISIKNNKIYVGQSRINQHLALLRENRHYSIELQKDFNLYGENNFVFEMIEDVELDTHLIEKEKQWIELLSHEYYLYNSSINEKREKNKKRKVKIQNGREKWERYKLNKKLQNNTHTLALAKEYAKSKVKHFYPNIEILKLI